MNKITKIIISATFGGAIFALWAQHPEVLSYHEQYQLFMFDFDYFIERICVAGGFIDYVSEFLTQFYYIPWLGATILALLFISIQVSTWKIAKHFGAKDSHYALSLIPSIILLNYMGDESVLLSFPLALSCINNEIINYFIFENKIAKTAKYILQPIFVSILYWLFGSVTFIYVIFVVIYEFKKHSINLSSISYSVYSIIITFIAIAIASNTYMSQYTLENIFGGVNYYRWYMNIQPMQFVVEIAFIITPLIICILPWKSIYLSITEIIAIAIGGFIYVQNGFDLEKCEQIRYDYYIRNERWDDIISRAEIRQPKSNFSSVAVNLALAMTNQLKDRMFEFYQPNSDALIMPFVPDLTSCMPTAEASFRLGLINSAQRFMFDMQECIPNTRLSARCTKVLTETNIVNGNYKVAQKYINYLKHTIFYSDWANETEKLLFNDSLVNKHPKYGRLRQLRYKDDFIYSKSNFDKMLGVLYVENNENQMALDYFLCQLLLDKNLNTFANHIQFLNPNNIGWTYQQSIAMWWLNEYKSFDGIPYKIDEKIKSDLIEFIQALQHNNANNKKWSKTYWYYYFTKQQ